MLFYTYLLQTRQYKNVTSYKANTVDFSEKGLSIKILDDLPIKEGDTVELTIGDNKVKAKVIRTNKQFDKSTVGLQRLN